jgi:hypothetical protein
MISKRSLHYSMFPRSCPDLRSTHIVAAPAVPNSRLLSTHYQTVATSAVPNPRLLSTQRETSSECRYYIFVPIPFYTCATITAWTWSISCLLMLYCVSSRTPKKSNEVNWLERLNVSIVHIDQLRLSVSYSPRFWLVEVKWEVKQLVSFFGAIQVFHCVLVWFYIFSVRRLKISANTNAVGMYRIIIDCCHLANHTLNRIVNRRFFA